MIGLNQHLSACNKEHQRKNFYIARAVETVQNMEGVKYEINPMGTTLESKSMDAILNAAKEMTDAIHNLGIKRVEQS